MDENPYAPPSSAPARRRLRRELSLLEIARPVFLAWERLRVIYVLLLAAATVLALALHLAEVETIVFVIKGAIVANVCFFAGPVIETCLRFLGFDHLWFRWSLFLSGTLLAVLLTLAATMSYLHPFDWD